MPGTAPEQSQYPLWKWVSLVGFGEQGEYPSSVRNVDPFGTRNIHPSGVRLFGVQLSSVRLSGVWLSGIGRVVCHQA